MLFALIMAAAIPPVQTVSRTIYAEPVPLAKTTRGLVEDYAKRPRDRKREEQRLFEEAIDQAKAAQRPQN
jgi:hypothetical protein